MENEKNKAEKPEMNPMLASGMMLQGGKYRIEKVLGQGGFGITYLATMMMWNQKVAIKEFFFKEFCERDEQDSTVIVPTQGKRDLVDRFEKKFVKEAKIIFGLRHENIVKLLDVFQENGTSYYAMEYIEGTSLADEIKAHGAMSVDRALEVMKSVCSALGHIHSHHINHLDIKPGNIMLDKKENRVVLIDFGVSKQYNADTGGSTTTTPVGISEGYSPLEQYNLGGVSNFSPESDIYALGATMYKMLTGKTPPTAIDVSQNGLPDFPSNVPQSLVEAIKKSMASIMRNRQHTVEEFWEAISACTQEEDDDDEDESTSFVDPATAKPAEPSGSPQPEAPAAPSPSATTAKPVSPSTPSTPAGKDVSKKSNTLKYVGIAAAAVFVLFFGWLFFSDDPVEGTDGENQEYVDDGGAELESLMLNFMNRVNSSCPIQVADDVVLTKIVSEEDCYEFYYEVNKPKLVFEQETGYMDMLQNPVERFATEDDARLKKVLQQYGIIYRQTFKFSDSEELYSVDVASDETGE